MCGIAGIINLQGRETPPEAVISAMTGTLTHRGPDDHGIFCEGPVALGHRRLSIIDLSEKGRQPMTDTENTAVITCNGEFYNFRELRRQLISKGFTFRSGTDTEVALSAYREYGTDFFQHLQGMFAFCIYDRLTERCILARDRLGIKPLYYAECGGRLVFASEIKALLKYPGMDVEPDMEAVSCYLSYRYPTGHRTFFRGIRSLLPGHYLEITGEGTSLHQYWDLPVITDMEDRGEAFYVKKLRRVLEESVASRMISDVPLGAYLSGGLDSGVIVSIMAGLSGKRVKTFTIGFNEDGYNEFDYSAMVADRYNTDHNTILMKGSGYMRAMEELISFRDAPLGVPNEPALYVMSQELKKQITVVLSGEGADEILGGYGRIFRSPMDYRRMKFLQNPGNPEPGSPAGILKQNLENKYGRADFNSEAELFLHLYRYMGQEDRERYLSPEALESMGIETDSLVYELFERAGSLGMYDRNMWVFEKFHLPGLLHRLDTTTMAASVEARVPFVDHRLVEFAMSVPACYKMRWKSLRHRVAASVLTSDRISEDHDITKYLLRRAFHRDLPGEVVSRKKVGFPVPLHTWFGRDLNVWARELLLDRTAHERGIWNTRSIESTLDSGELFRDHNRGLHIWMLVNIELWLRKYF